MMRKNGRQKRAAALMSLGLLACGAREAAEDVVPPDAGAGESAQDGQAGGQAGSRRDAPPPRFPPGVYACTSSLQTFDTGAGGSGTLTLTQTGATLTATYTGDYAATGTLEFVATTDGSANPASSGQSFDVYPCVDTDRPDGGSEPESVTAGSLTLDGDSLFMTIIGTPEGDPGCATPATLTLTCTRTQ